MESETVFTKQQRIAQNARIHPKVSFTSLAHHLDLEWLKEAYKRTRKDGALGVDRQSAETYARNLEGNLRDLLERAKSGQYVAPPVRRVHIQKDKRETRPIGIPTFEDKVLQRAVQMVLEPLYEQDFLECSYGFRPGRSAHDALEALWHKAMDGGWIIDLDIRKFFDTMSPSHLREILRIRMRDGVLARLIGKWLKAGVWEHGAVSYPESGTPQGGVISPLLSNIYLHTVLDKWFLEEVRPRMAGRASLIRYADDAVLLFESERDARRVLAVLPKRFERFGLTVHPDKTRMIRYEQPTASTEEQSDRETFDFLGFTHYWGRSRRGRWVVRRKTASARYSRSLRAVHDWCKRNRHLPLETQQYALRRKLLGHYAYYGITDNSLWLARYLHEVQRIWRYWLRRRNRERSLTWERFHLLLARYPLPPARVVRSAVAAKP